MFRLQDFVNLIGVIGLGLAPITNYSSLVGGVGEQFIGRHIDARQITMAVQFLDNNGLSGILQSRKEVLAAINPHSTPDDEPVRIMYQLEDMNGAPAGDMLTVDAWYQSGLEQDTTNEYSQVQEKTALTFKAFLPLVVRDGSEGGALNLGAALSNARSGVMRTPSGVWQNLNGIAASDGIQDAVIGADGNLYVVGNFTTIGGISANRIAKLDLNTMTWSAIGTGLNNIGTAIAVGLDGLIYVGGYFTQANGVAANRAAILNPTTSTFSAMGSGLDYQPYIIEVAPNGSVYYGGAFTTAGGVTNTFGIAMWNGAWNAVGNGLDPAVYAIAFDKAGNLYVGRELSPYLVKLVGGAWQTVTPAPNGAVNSLAFSPDGKLYVGGAYTTIGGVTYNRIAVLNNNAWSPAGKNASEGPLSGAVQEIAFDTNGTVYVGGTFTSISRAPTMPSIPVDGIATIRRGIWSPTEIDLNTSDVRKIFSTPYGAIYMFGFWNSVSSAVSSTPIVNSGAQNSYPIFTITGPGSLWEVRNFTTGKSIVISNLTLAAGEKAVLTLLPGQISFVSNVRGSLMSYIIQGSSFDFPIMPGTNDLEVMMTNTTGNSSATVEWQPSMNIDDSGW